MNAKVLKLMRLAMEISQSGKAHAFCEYSGHVDGVYYWVNSKRHDYDADHQAPCIIDHANIWLKHEGASKKLDAAIAQFESLLTESAA